MTAIPHSTFSPAPCHSGLEPTTDPLASLAAPSRTALRRQEVQRTADEILTVATDAGWKVRRHRVYSGGLSLYFILKLSRRRQVTLRVSDHCPSRPLGLDTDETPVLLVITDTPGGLQHAKRWLISTAEDHAAAADDPDGPPPFEGAVGIEDDRIGRWLVLAEVVERHIDRAEDVAGRLGMEFDTVLRHLGELVGMNLIQQGPDTKGWVPHDSLFDSIAVAVRRDLAGVSA